MLQSLLAERNLPPLLTMKDGNPVRTPADFEKRQAEIRTILSEQIYGFLPPPPISTAVEVCEEMPGFAAGSASFTRYRMTLTLPGGRTASFPFVAVIPRLPRRVPALVLINFRPDVPDRYLPSEELSDLGYAVFSFCYKDVTSDNNDFTDGLAGALYPDGTRGQTDAGKIMIWAYAAMQVRAYAAQIPGVDAERIGVCGHSRLGKTALVAAGYDPAFAFAISNDSGCSGAALTRKKEGERVADITRVFPFWFNRVYPSYSEREEEMPFEQHWLLALTAPRPLLIGSAEEDTWADPASEFLAALAASPAWELYGRQGLVTPDRLPAAPVSLDDGWIHYHLRHGKHYLSRRDYLAYIPFLDAVFRR